ncbi:MAG: DUF61 family protein [Methanomassiliicoccaceae archaeon]|nr:DUF61 family protein [Methanomassiliicoccaceae archaeon]
MEIEHILSGINDHAPVARRSLAEYIDSNDLTYRTRSNHVCELTRNEIDILNNICEEREKLTLRLPIMVMTDTSFTESVWKIEGRTEVSVVSKLLSKRSLRDDLIHLYHPHLRELQKMLPNSVTVLFVP